MEDYHDETGSGLTVLHRKNDQYLLVKHGPFGGEHDHYDKLEFSYACEGKMFPRIWVLPVTEPAFIMTILKIRFLITPSSWTRRIRLLPADGSEDLKTVLNMLSSMRRPHGQRIIRFRILLLSDSGAMRPMKVRISGGRSYSAMILSWMWRLRSVPGPLLMYTGRKGNMPLKRPAPPRHGEQGKASPTRLYTERKYENRTNVLKRLAQFRKE